MRALAVAVWHKSSDREAFLQHMKISILDLSAYGDWLMTSTGDWINLVLLLLWAWDQRMAAETPTGKLPESAPSDGSPTVRQWCSKRGLVEVDEAVLKKLGFVVGDNLNCLSETDWVAAGALALQRVRILQAFQKHDAA